MLYYLLFPLREYFTVFNVFKYITFRAAFASITAFLITVIFAPPIIRKLQSLKIGENVREKECPNLYDKHKNKQGTPTMGGILILIGVFSSTFLFAELDNYYLLLALFVTLYMAVLGFVDDYKKLVYKKTKSGRRGLNKIGRASCRERG